jgi:lipopolysaccharide transport system ATP-binding protein
LPVLQGVYPLSIWCTVGEELEDLVANAAQLSVVEGDFYGTGTLPPKVNGDVLIRHSFSVEGE